MMSCTHHWCVIGLVGESKDKDFIPYLIVLFYLLQLLIGFETGAIVLWDLKSKTAEFRYNAPEALRSISWHHEGKQFMCSHTDGSLTTYNIKTPQKPMSVMMPHAKIGKDGKPDPCKPIAKVEWKSLRNSDPLVIFSGGMSYERAGRTTPSITVMNGKSTTVLEMEHNVVDFVPLCETPWQNDFQEPYAIVVLLQNDLVVVDLTTPGYPCFENPYPMDLHESPVTALQYYADCPPDLIPAFYSVGSKQKRTGFSEKSWPIKGGEWGTSTCSYPEIVITGHADGSLKFWDASSVTLQVLYKMKTAKFFEKLKNKNTEEDDPFAIYLIYLCTDSRVICLAGSTHVILLKFSKQETSLEIASLDISIVYEVCDDLESPDYEYPKPSLGVVSQQSGSMGSYSSNTSDSLKMETSTLLKVRSGCRKYSSGYLPELVCLLTWLDNEHPGNITSICVNSSYGLLAFGNESGLAIIDYFQKTCLLNLGTPDLYGKYVVVKVLWILIKELQALQEVKSSQMQKVPVQKNRVAHLQMIKYVQQLVAKIIPSSPPSSPRTKKNNHTLTPESGLLAIHEIQSFENEPEKSSDDTLDDSSSQSSFSKTTAELDNIINNLNNNDDTVDPEEIMRKELLKLSDSDKSKKSIERTLSLPPHEDEKFEVKESLPPKSKSENALKVIEKRKAVKTVSDPSAINELIDKHARRRSCSEPQIDAPLKLHKEHKMRKLSVKNLKFHRHKGKHKKEETENPDSSINTAENKDLDQSHDQSHGKDNHDYKSDSSDDILEEEPPIHSRNFLRRMSVKVKAIVLGDKHEEKKFKLDIIDLSQDKGKPVHLHMTVAEYLGHQTGMSKSLEINDVLCSSPTCSKQKRHPELKRTKSSGTRKLQKAQSVVSMEESNGGGAISASNIYFTLLLL
ncbi:hypothetical protein KUTeg_007494 [Tegillarca granosa]|uniref:Lethal giant larvae homologue 2 domain-containing protein n=1 Tax=Tegillarca granosa TaxID=220873 RepID=A0ABQ9FDG6_TEGGR|nr:hypothetical protein KUTeg_007494 [Tegillarca granosa]